ncbi:MAG: sugar phosphate nucleotidyltransferase [Clostridiales bacterium]|nr:sugar phosphate nucleotidyltransferase [Clostridiales bacterium]
MKTIIMAGGEGSRLRPLTAGIPKPMMPLLDKPVMEHILGLLKKHSLAEVGATLMYLPQQIEEYFGNGRNFGVNLQYFREELPLGTAGSVKNAEIMLDEAFLVISGDALTDCDLSSLIAWHRQKGAAVTIALKQVTTPLEYGVVIVNEEGQIEKFLEKPSWGQVFSDLVNTGIYVIEREILDYIPDGKPFDFSRDLFPLLMKENIPIYGCAISDYWCDIGNLHQYMQAHYDILEGNVRLDTMPHQGIWLSPGAKISPLAYLESPVFIGPGVRVEDGVFISKSVIGEGCLIETGASVKNSIIWRNSRIGRKSQLRAVACAHEVSTGTHASIFEGAVLGAKSRVEEYATVAPGCKIWPGKIVTRESKAQGSLVWSERHESRVFGAKGIQGPFLETINPELMLELGFAYAAHLGKGKEVLVAKSPGKAACLLQSSLAAGLAAGACQVQKGENLTLPAWRYSVWQNSRLAGGIYIQAEGDNIAVHCCDSQGLYLDIKGERKIESLMERGERIPYSSQEAGEINQAGDLSGPYQELLASLLPEDCLDLSLAIACDNPMLISYLRDICQKRGASLYALDGEDIKAETLTATVSQYKCLLGAHISADGESLHFVDESGGILNEHLTIPLLSFPALTLQSGKKRLIMPQMASKAMESLAAKQRAELIRGRNQIAAQMRENFTDLPKGDNRAYCAANLFFDGAMGALALANYLLSQTSSLAWLYRSLPDINISSREIYCPWESKGEVMRRLVEENKNRRLDMIDGVKVRYDDAWVMVLPDDDKPVCHVYSEAQNMEAAEDLTDFYAKKIKDFQGDE